MLEKKIRTRVLLFFRTHFRASVSKMASLEDDDVIEEDHLESLLVFPPEVQEAIDQVDTLENTKQFLSR